MRIGAEALRGALDRADEEYVKVGGMVLGRAIASAGSSFMIGTPLAVSVGSPAANLWVEALEELPKMTI